LPESSNLIECLPFAGSLPGSKSEPTEHLSFIASCNSHCTFGKGSRGREEGRARFVISPQIDSEARSGAEVICLQEGDKIVRALGGSSAMSKFPDSRFCERAAL
jgi:hypothetical protein